MQPMFDWGSEQECQVIYSQVVKYINWECIQTCKTIFSDFTFEGHILNDILVVLQQGTTCTNIQS